VVNTCAIDGLNYAVGGTVQTFGGFANGPSEETERQGNQRSAALGSFTCDVSELFFYLIGQNLKGDGFRNERRCISDE
jgi:hypothetical protein